MNKQILSLKNVAATLALLGTITVSNAELLIHEGFDYDIGLTHLDGVATNATGLSGNWSQRHTQNSGQASDVVSGLTFGSLVTSGNAFMLADRTNTSGDRYNELHATISATSTSGTIWHSHLIQLGVRDEGDTNNSSNPNSRWQSQVAINGSTMGRTTTPTIGFRPTRDGSTSEGNVALAGGSTSGGNAMNYNETYLVVGKLTGLHDAGVGVQKVADMWVLDPTHFSSVVSDGFSESSLDANNLYKLSRSVTNDAEISLSGLLHLHTVDWTEQNFTPTYDEIRFGTTAESVMPVPEPGTLALIGIALSALVLFRRRQR